MQRRSEKSHIINDDVPKEDSFLSEDKEAAENDTTFITQKTATTTPPRKEEAASKDVSCNELSYNFFLYFFSSFLTIFFLFKVERGEKISKKSKFQRGRILYL